LEKPNLELGPILGSKVRFMRGAFEPLELFKSKPHGTPPYPAQSNVALEDLHVDMCG